MCSQRIAAGAGAVYLVSRVAYAKGYYTGGRLPWHLRYCMRMSLNAFTNHFRSKEQTLGRLWPPFRNSFAWIYCFLGLPSAGMGWKALIKVMSNDNDNLSFDFWFYVYLSVFVDDPTAQVPVNGAIENYA